MSEKATGVITRNADAYIATFEAAEQAEGQIRLVQIISITAGKIPEVVGVPTRHVVNNDSLSITTLSGYLLGDNSHLVCYVKHKEPGGSCLVTPLLCDNNNQVIGTLESKYSKVSLTLASGTAYLSPCLRWEFLGTGAWSIFPHVCQISEANEIDLWLFVV
jgi:hypothetical protein